MTAPRPRKPAVFSPDDPHVVVSASRDAIDAIVAAENALPLTAASRPKPRFPWRKVLYVAAGGLVSLALGLAVTRLIEELFARVEMLGWLGLVLAFGALWLTPDVGPRQVTPLLILDGYARFYIGLVLAAVAERVSDRAALALAAAFAIAALGCFALLRPPKAGRPRSRLRS